MPHHAAGLRLASHDESSMVAAIARETRTHFMPYLPVLHSFEEDERFFRDIVFRECDVWVSTDKGAVVGFCAFKENWLDHLYLLPNHVRQGRGRALLQIAKERNDTLQLWVFQANIQAIRFYEGNGFCLIKRTDGAGNEENCPDALYAWHR